MSIGLRTRIFGGFAVIIALILALGVITITALQSLDGDLRDRGRAGAAADAVRAIDGAAVGARGAVEAWLRESTLEQGRTVGERLERVRAALATAAEHPDVAAQSRHIEAVSSSLDAYRRSWQEVQNLTRTMERVWRTAIIERGGRISQELRLIRDMATAQPGSSALESLNRAYDEFAIARLELMRYRATNDAAAHGAALESLETALREVDKVQLFITEQEQIERVEHAFEAINQFRDSATQTKTLVERRQEIVAAFARAGEAIDAAIGAMRTAFDAAAHEAEARAGANIAWTNQAVIIAVAGVLALGVLLGWLIGRSIARPIAAITGAMEGIAGGALETEIPALARRDEMGAMARALQVFRDGLTRAKSLEAEAAAEREKAEGERRAAMLKMANAFEESVGGVVRGVASAAEQMQAAARSLTTTAEATTSQATAVAAASEQATSNVQAVASAAEQMNASISDIGRQVAGSAQVAGRAVEEAERTNATIKGLAETAQKIGDVVKLISDIAGQTNLLALNATIEAARAGEAGKGFAVVASEVKSLASQTAKATDEIAAQIAAIQGATGGAVQAIAGIGRIITEINETARVIAHSVEEQGAATQEIARNVSQAAAGTGEVSSTIGTVNSSAVETGEAAKKMLTAAGDLAGQSDTLRRAVDEFLVRVRAA